MRNRAGLLIGLCLSVGIFRPTAAHAEEMPFPDVPREQWAAPAVHRISLAGLVEGRSGGVFAGNEAVTRYELAVTCARLLKRARFMETPMKVASYSDVPTGHWAFAAVTYLDARALVEGLPDGRFDGNRAVSRNECAQLMARILQLFREDPEGDAQLAAGTGIEEFVDLPQNNPARASVRRLIVAGVIEGFADGTFRGDQKVTRYQLSVMLARLTGRYIDYLT